MRRCCFLVLALLLPLVVITPALAAGQAVADAGACRQNTLPANDDGSSDEVFLPFSLNFYGTPVNSLWVNNNGNVTFDGPLAQYTPFGLVGTNSKIIAPFFADVDTRAAGSRPTTYGFGETLFEGRRAFCVSWIDVGYYPTRSDVTNSFQLLLVEHAESGPGDFDLVFNYDRIDWETGDASGGADGRGGTSAHAGFSNGTGNAGSSFEIAGSGQVGALLDGGARSLTGTSTGSAVAGRHRFAVRSGAAPTTTYVALGDSYQSGEGTGTYLAGTDVRNMNECHRSALAYPELVAARRGLPLVFAACSGATTADLYETVDAGGPPWDDGVSQLDRLGRDTTLVTIGIGGNDMKFGPILRGCIADLVGDRALRRLFPRAESSCESEYADDLDRNRAELVDADKLRDAYLEIRERAPYARVVVLGYPRFFVRGGSNSPLVGACEGIRTSDQLWINGEIRRLNALVRKEATALGLRYLDAYDLPAGKELCSDAPPREQFLNGIVASDTVESFHPKALGHVLLADAVQGALGSPAPGQRVVVRQDTRERLVATVRNALRSFTFTTSWPGSDVVMTLTSPSGRTIGRDTVADDVEHVVGDTFETYRVRDPEPGEWRVELFGARVAPLGEDVDVVLEAAEAVNQRPTAVADVVMEGRTVRGDASASSDLDGRATKFLWDFGDGSTSAGPVATHRYSRPGTYSVTTVVTDDDGDVGVVESDDVFSPVCDSRDPLPFTDMRASDVHAAAVACAAANSIARGREDGSCDPAGPVTRAQVASFVARMLDSAGVVLPEGPAQPFTDVEGTHALSVAQLAAVGVVQGRTATAFEPEAPVRRDQMASLLRRAYDLTAEAPLTAGPDAFGDDDGSVHEDAINALALAGVARGRDARTFDPAGSVQRDQMASFLTRTLTIVVGAP